MDGIINLHKPAGITSHGAVVLVRRAAPGVKVGHAGTLDPAAAGVLPICLGRATRVAEYIMDLPKGYRAAISLGVATTTGDAEGTILSRSTVPVLEKRRVEKLLFSLTGFQEQETPAFSAAKHRGRPLYHYARRGEAVPVKKRTVQIYRLDLLAFSPEQAPQIICEVECSRGTYIRVLAEEIGRRLGCGAHLQALERFFVGPFDIASAVTPQDVDKAAASGNLGEILLPTDEALTGFQALCLPDKAVEDLRAGRTVPWRCLDEAEISLLPEGRQLLRIYDTRGEFKALARVGEDSGVPFLQTEKFLAP